MAHIELQAQYRTKLGNDARKLRREGIIPAVLFSKAHGSDSIQVVFSDFFKVYKQSGKNHVIELQIGDKKFPCIVHGIDVHPVKGLPRHIDFLSVDLKKKVSAQVPVNIEGEPIGVKEQGAVLIVDLEEVEVEALPDQIPDSIIVNVTELKKVGDNVTIKELPQSDKYEYITEIDQRIATLVAQSKDEDFDSGVETPIIEGEEGVESSVDEVSDGEKPSDDLESTNK